MEAIFSWVGAALGALFVVAVAVAWWEHLLRQTRPPAPAEPAAPRVVSVDVPLDSVIDTPPPAPSAAPSAAPAAPPALPSGDAAERRATLDGAISRMARPAPPELGAWPETTPMVLHPPAETPDAGTAAAPAPAPATSHTRA